MNTVEKKIDICLRWILADGKEKRNEIAMEAASLLRQNTEAANFVVEDFTENLLRELGVSQALLGFNYMVYAINLVVDDEEYINGVTTKLYPAVAKKFDTTAPRAERAMRHAVEKTFDNGDYDLLVKIFGGGISKFGGKVTNSEFIAGCAREVRRRMRGSTVLEETNNGKL